MILQWKHRAALFSIDKEIHGNQNWRTHIARPLRVRWPQLVMLSLSKVNSGVPEKAMRLHLVNNSLR
jgi:hypothetical protein